MNSKLDYPNNNEINSNDKVPKIISINIDNTLSDFDDIMSEETCPNCGSSLFDGKCENINECGYGHAQDYFEELKNQEEAGFLEHEKLSEVQKGNGKKHLMSTMNGKKFHFYNYFGRIESDKANIQIEVDGEKLKMNVSYQIIEEDGIKKIGKINFNGKIKKSINSIWTDTFYPYKDLKKFLVVILSDTRFNKHF